MRADIHNGQEHKCSVHGPDTDAQDQPPPSLTFGLQHTAGPYKRVTTVMPYMRVFGQRPHQPSLTSGLLWPVTDRSPMVSQIGRQSHKTLKPLQMLIPLLMQKLVVNHAIEAMIEEYGSARHYFRWHYAALARGPELQAAGRDGRLETGGARTR
jgi:hypothetical protein